MWDEYLYGDGLPVAPVTAALATERAVDLPAGRWMN
jgi:alpha-glucosidase (family GH31 glycosyl hydrolase)